MGTTPVVEPSRTNARPCLMNKTSASDKITRTTGWGCAGRAYKPDHMITGSVGARAHTRLLALSSFFVKQHHLTLTAHQP